MMREQQESTPTHYYCQRTPDRQEVRRAIRRAY